MLTTRLYRYPSWGVRSSFDDLSRMRSDMDRLLTMFTGGPSERTSSGVFPAVNMSEDADNYYIRAELPGLTADELDIQVTGKTLAIAGERKIPTEGENAKYHRREREAGKFSRIIGLPGDIDSGKVAAGLENGILKIAVPKAEEAKPRQITVT